MEKPEAEHHPIDRGWAWVVLFACFLEQLLLIGSHASFGILFNEFTVAFNSSATSISIALSVQTVVLSLASLIILSVGSQWLSNRTFVMMGAVTAFAAYIFNAFLPGISYLILSQGVLFGFTHACVQGPSLVILGRYFKKYRGLATTLANFGASTGIFIFPLVLRSLIDFYGLRGALVIQSGLLLNLLVAGSLFRPLSFYDKLPKKYLEGAEKGARVDREQQEQLLQGKQSDKSHSDLDERDTLHTANADNSTDFSREESKNCNQNYKDHLLASFNEIPPQSQIRVRTFSDSLKERPKQNNGNHLKLELHHSTKSLNKLLDRVAISGDLAVTSSTGDIIGSVYSVCSAISEKQGEQTGNGDQNTNANEINQKSQSKMIKFLIELISLKCLKIRIFQIWLIVAFFGILGTAQIITYLPPLAAEKNVDERNRVFLLTIVGASDIVGKIFLALITRFTMFSKALMIAIALWILAISFTCVLLYTDFVHFVVFAAIIGSTTGVYFALFPAVLADFVGLENLSGAMGLTMLTHGLALTIGNPILGSIRDSIGTFNGSFLYTGGCTFVSAAAMTIAHFYEKKSNRNLQNRHDIIEIVADEP
uniref:Monocarboxylate transporter 12-like n=1 Tax=Crassostrea virginica TaxID=6565 RepID=A0A8B8AEJ4_CRAVI|nr:monocarboxylate transporter 12-like [Crassostrea virginica]